MFYFGIPVRSAQVTKDWDHHCRLLQATVRSALASEAPVRVILACHELPDIEPDPRVTMLQVDLPIPSTVPEKTRDKGQKKRRIVEEVATLGGGYLMHLDSDDLVSARLAPFVLQDDNRRGYLLRDGYLYDYGNGRISRDRRFDAHCGSCAVFYVPSDPSPEDRKFVASTRHYEVGKVARESGRPFAVVPFPAAVAVKNNGENFADVLPRTRQSLATRVARLFTASPSRDLRAEFGFPTSP